MSEIQTQAESQQFHILYKNGQSLSSSPDSQVISIPVTFDPSIGRDVVLWEDILLASKDTIHIHNGTSLVPFVKGIDLKSLEPKRILAMQHTILDMVVEEIPTSSVEHHVSTGNNTVVTKGLNASEGVETILLDINPESPKDNISESSVKKTMESPLGPRQEDHEELQNILLMDNKDDRLMQYYTKALEEYLESFEQNSTVVPLNLEIFSFALVGDFFEALDSGDVECYLEALSSEDFQQIVNILNKHEIGPPDELIPQEMEWDLELTQQRNADAQLEIGIIYYLGKDIPQDYSKAMEWYLRSAEQGNSDAQCCIGILYRNGEGVSQDYSKAMEWYLRSAEQGNSDVQRSIGILYHNGEGVPQDYSKAMEWCLRSLTPLNLTIGANQYDIIVQSSDVPQLTGSYDEKFALREVIGKPPSEIFIEILKESYPCHNLNARANPLFLSEAKKKYVLTNNSITNILNQDWDPEAPDILNMCHRFFDGLMIVNGDTCICIQAVELYNRKESVDKHVRRILLVALCQATLILKLLSLLVAPTSN